MRYNEGTLITTTQNVNSILNFGGNLTLISGGEEYNTNSNNNNGTNFNIEQATITSQNINQEGLDTTIVTTTNYEHNEIKPDYTGIATGAAITGFVAGLTVVGSEYIEGVTGAKPNGNVTSYDGTSQVGVNVVEVDGQLFTEIKPGVINFEKPVQMGTGFGQYNCLGGFCSQYTNNPIFQVFNMQPGGASFAFWHDTGLAGASDFWTMATIPGYYITHQFVVSGAVGAGIISNELNSKPKSILFEK